MPVVPQLGRQEIPAGLSLKKFCEALSMAVGVVLYFSAFSMDRLTKRFIFYSSGRKMPHKKERKMKQC